MKLAFKKIDYVFTKKIVLSVIAPEDLHPSRIQACGERFSQTELEDLLFSDPTSWVTSWTTEAIHLPAENRNEDSILSDKDTHSVNDDFTSVVFAQDATWWVATEAEIAYERQSIPHPAQLEFTWR